MFIHEQQADVKQLEFDKRTALGAKSSFPSLIPASLIGTDFSRALAASVSTNILSVVPQLDDYLCPICFQLAYRPIRLRCQHVFCIRCLIVMQRTRKNNCALCREPTVMEADNTNLDVALQNFLKRYFKDEAKQKQKANEKAAFEDEFPGMTHSECSVM
jgi:E3 ubiquitin-protein ligase BAH